MTRFYQIKIFYQQIQFYDAFGATLAFIPYNTKGNIIVAVLIVGKI